MQIGASVFAACAVEASNEERLKQEPVLIAFFSGWSHYETLTD